MFYVTYENKLCLLTGYVTPGSAWEAAKRRSAHNGRSLAYYGVCEMSPLVSREVTHEVTTFVTELVWEKK